MAKGNHRDTIYDKDHRPIGEVERAHAPDKPRPRKVARTLLMIVAAVGAGYYLATPAGQQTFDRVMERLSPPANAGR